MKFTEVVLCSAFLLCGRTAFAQEWEIGGIGGAGVFSGANATSSFGSATTGMKGGAAFGGFLGHQMYERLSGEFHYTYRQGDLKVTSGGSEATFKGLSHMVHYDVVFYANKRKAKVRPFVAAGGGLKVFRGTGKEAAYQPLSNFAYLTKTQELKPMASVGAGIKIQIAPKIFLRTEFRDYISTFPKTVIAPAPGVKFSSILQDIVPMVGISAVF